nr:hypothetical protein [Tanacetum cinerariifolium]
MSGTIPPILPPFETSFGNPSSPNMVDTIGGSHVIIVPDFDKEDFTSWNVRFLVFLDGLEPYLLKTLDDGPFVPMSSLSTSENPLPKRQHQWSNAESHIANQDKRLKTHEGPSDTRDTKIASLRLKFNAFKSLEDVEEDQRTNNEFMADLTAEYHERALLENQKRFYKRPDRVGSTRKPLDKTKETCFACGKLGYFQKDYPTYKTSTPSYLSSNNSFNKSKPYTPSFNQTSSQNSGNHKKDYKGKYKGLKAKLAVLTKRIDDLTKEKCEKGKKKKEKSEKCLLVESFDWDDESVSSYDEENTKIRAFMAIAEDEPSVGKVDARSGQWVDITMKKVHRLLSMTDGD